jgi:hypothetical protein
VVASAAGLPPVRGLGGLCRLRLLCLILQDWFRGARVLGLAAVEVRDEEHQRATTRIPIPRSTSRGFRLFSVSRPSKEHRCRKNRGLVAVVLFPFGEGASSSDSVTSKSGMSYVSSEGEEPARLRGPAVGLLFCFSCHGPSKPDCLFSVDSHEEFDFGIIRSEPVRCC